MISVIWVALEKILPTSDHYFLSCLNLITAVYKSVIICHHICQHFEISAIDHLIKSQNDLLWTGQIGSRCIGGGTWGHAPPGKMAGIICQQLLLILLFGRRIIMTTRKSL